MGSCGAQGAQLGARCSPRGWDGGGKEAQEGGGICIKIADCLCSIA